MDRRQNLMDDLATVSTDHALAGFVVSIRKEDFEDAVDNGPGIKEFIDSPYAICFIRVLEEISNWVAQTYSDNKVYCWFEDGGNHQVEAHELFLRLSGNPGTKADFLKIGGLSFLPKAGVPACCFAPKSDPGFASKIDPSESARL